MTKGLGIFRMSMRSQGHSPDGATSLVATRSQSHSTRGVRVRTYGGSVQHASRSDARFEYDCCAPGVECVVDNALTALRSRVAASENQERRGLGVFRSMVVGRLGRNHLPFLVPHTLTPSAPLSRPSIDSEEKKTSINPPPPVLFFKPLFKNFFRTISALLLLLA